jgi:hypothetical protein
MQNIGNYQLNIYGTGKIGVLITTGPIAFTLAVNPILNNHKHRLADITELGFRYSIFEVSGKLLAHQKKFDYHYSNIVSEPIILTH